jgi:hypothetical protein
MTKYYYIILGSIGAALLIALLVISYVDRTVLQPAPSVGEATAPEMAGGPPGTSAPASAAGNPLPALITPKEGGEQVPAALNLRLIGTTVFGDKSTAIIEDLDSKMRGVYRLRDAIKGYIISVIEADSVTLTWYRAAISRMPILFLPKLTTAPGWCRQTRRPTWSVISINMPGKSSPFSTANTARLPASRSGI